MKIGLCMYPCFSKTHILYILMRMTLDLFTCNCFCLFEYWNKSWPQLVGSALCYFFFYYDWSQISIPVQLLIFDQVPLNNCSMYCFHIFIVSSLSNKFSLFRFLELFFVVFYVFLSFLKLFYVCFACSTAFSVQPNLLSFSKFSLFSILYLEISLVLRNSLSSVRFRIFSAIHCFLSSVWSIFSSCRWQYTTIFGIIPGSDQDYYTFLNCWNWIKKTRHSNHLSAHNFQTVWTQIPYP